MGVGQSKTYDVCKIQKEAGGRSSTSIKKEDYSIIQLKNEVKKNIEETEKRKNKVNWQEPTTSKVFEENVDTQTPTQAVFEKISVKHEDQKKEEGGNKTKESEGLEKENEETLNIIIQNESRSDVAAEIKEMMQNIEEIEATAKEVDELKTTVNQENHKEEKDIIPRTDSLTPKEENKEQEIKENEIVVPKFEPQPRRVGDVDEENKNVVDTKIKEEDIVEDMIATVNLQKNNDNQQERSAIVNQQTVEVDEPHPGNAQTNEAAEKSQSVKNSAEINEKEIVEEMIATVNLHKHNENQIEVKPQNEVNQQKVEMNEVETNKAAEVSESVKDSAKINEKGIVEEMIATVNLPKQVENKAQANETVEKHESVKDSTKVDEKEIIEEMIATVNLQKIDENEARTRKISNVVAEKSETAKVPEEIEGIVENIKAKIEEAKELDSEINSQLNIKESASSEMVAEVSKDIIENHINKKDVNVETSREENKHNEEIKVNIEVHQNEEQKEKVEINLEEIKPEKPESISQFLQTIHQIEEEVKTLKDQIIQFNGTTEDIQYKILYDSLINYIIKLDDIIVTNNDEIRNERKRVIKFVQEWTQTLERNVEKKTKDDNSDLD